MSAASAFGSVSCRHAGSPPSPRHPVRDRRGRGEAAPPGGAAAFVAAAGGADARIAVVPTASSLGSEVIEVYRAVFTSLGAGEVLALRPQSRAEADDPDLLEPLDHVSASS